VTLSHIQVLYYLETAVPTSTSGTSLSAAVSGNSSSSLLCALLITSFNCYFVHDTSVIHTQGGWKLESIFLTKNKMKMVAVTTILCRLPHGLGSSQEEMGKNILLLRTLVLIRMYYLSL
jgi:hypothetical protein